MAIGRAKKVKVGAKTKRARRKQSAHGRTLDFAEWDGSATPTRFTYIGSPESPRGEVMDVTDAQAGRYLDELG
jgi:hypothetical protein